MPRKTTRMLREGQYREQAKKQWEKLDVESRKIINDLIVADKDRTIWPENTEPKFTRKKGAKLIKVAFDTKSKKYTHAYEEKEEVPVNEAIRLDIPDAHIYFCFHPTKNEYVVIDAPNRQEPDAKYIVTAPLCHWIQNHRSELHTQPEPTYKRHLRMHQQKKYCRKKSPSKNATQNW